MRTHYVLPFHSSNCFVHPLVHVGPEALRQHVPWNCTPSRHQLFHLHTQWPIFMGCSQIAQLSRKCSGSDDGQDEMMQMALNIMGVKTTSKTHLLPGYGWVHFHPDNLQFLNVPVWHIVWRICSITELHIFLIFGRVRRVRHK